MHFRILETWRLAAAITVMVYHFLRYAPEGQNAEWGNYLFRLLPLMDMFFMISGLLIMLRYGDHLLDGKGAYLKFIGRRFARIYPIYIATLLFFILGAIAANMGYGEFHHAQRFDFSTLPQNLLLIQGWGLGGYLTFNYVTWTLSAEWFCYLLLPIIVLTYHRGGAIGLAVLAAVVIAILHMASVLGYIPDGMWMHSYAWAAYRAFADFALGALIAVTARSTPLTLRSHWLAWGVFAAAIAAMLTLQGDYIVLSLLFASIFLAAVVERNNPDGSKFLSPLHPIGRVSFGIYILHPVVEATLFNVVWRKIVEPMHIMSFWTYWYIPMIASIVLAVLSDRYYEGPASKMISRWLDRLMTGSSGSSPKPP
ncbi:acyltransferase, partial [Escherichia coli]|nr:acyltransferase [Escherichia coli]